MIPASWKKACWIVAKAVAQQGQLGVVSGTALDNLLIRRLQDGDIGGHIRRAMDHFPSPSVASETLKRFFNPEGRAEGEPYALVPMYKQAVDTFRNQLTIMANFVEVWLAKEGHDGAVGINFLAKVQMPTLPSLYGAMLAGVDYVLMGAGIPREIPGALDALANHYEGLATPSNPGGYDDMFLAHVQKDIAVMIQLLPQSQLKLDPEGVAKAISRLNNGKAPDISGIKAEYLKEASSVLNSALSGIFSRIYREGSIPTNLKSGFKVSIPKRNKDALLPTNHRGITITATVGKALEHSLAIKMEELKLLPQHGLQYGFTKGLAPNMSALGLTEAHTDAEELGLVTLVSTIDAQKAFDVVSHEILLHKLHDKVPPDLWQLLRNLHQDCKEVVRWQGETSRQYTVKQGIRQGGILSTVLYKQFIDGLLRSMESMELGVYIGTTYMGVPTCCDDILLLAHGNEELQAMLNCCNTYANKHRYSINPSKSTITACSKRKLPTSKSDVSWSLGDCEIPITTTYTHLGLERSATRSTPDIRDRVKRGRRSAYALMGTGLHGQGINPITCMRIINLFVTPILLHGLEAVILSKEDVKLLSSYHRTLLKHIQALPDRTASAGVYLLVDALPIEAELDLRILRFFGAITRMDSSNPLYQILHRQMSTKDTNSKSWFTHATAVGKKYGINLYHQISIPNTKESWKEITKIAVRAHWRAELLREMLEKTSIAALATFHMTHDGPHPIWTTCECNPQRVQAAKSRVRLMTGTFPLKSKQAKYNKNEPDPTCQLCGLEPEDVAHFILRCSYLKTERETAQSVRDKILPMCDDDWLFLVLNGALNVRSRFGLPIEQGPLRLSPDIAKNSSAKCSSSQVRKQLDSSCGEKKRGGSNNNSVLSDIEIRLNLCATNFCSAVDKTRRAKLLQLEVPCKPGGVT